MCVLALLLSLSYANAIRIEDGSNEMYRCCGNSTYNDVIELTDLQGSSPLLHCSHFWIWGGRSGTDKFKVILHMRSARTKHFKWNRSHEFKQYSTVGRERSFSHIARLNAQKANFGLVRQRSTVLQTLTKKKYVWLMF